MGVFFLFLSGSSFLAPPPSLLPSFSAVPVTDYFVHKSNKSRGRVVGWLAGWLAGGRPFSGSGGVAGIGNCSCCTLS